MSTRHQNISQMSQMFRISRDTIRARLKAANVAPSGMERNAPVYDVAKAAPAIFAKRCDVCGR